MDVVSKNDVIYLEFKSLKKYSFIKQATSTRFGGVSSLPGLETMNLGTYTRDTSETVQKNYRLFCAASGFNVNRLVLGNQSHSTNVRYATPDDCGKGIFSQRDYTDVDALVTDYINLPLVIHTADCVPVLFVDTVKRKIGAAHCGWRGTYGELAKLTLDMMISKFGTEPKDVECAIGPCICKNCYEVSADLYDKFQEKFGESKALINNNSSYYIDLSLLNSQILISCGVRPENIKISDLCTCCNKDFLYSHRGLGAERGIFSSVIELI